MQRWWGYGARAWRQSGVAVFWHCLAIQADVAWFLCDEFVRLVELRLTVAAVISVDAGGFMVISLHVCVLSCLR
jgi:hypothetical protein